MSTRIARNAPAVQAAAYATGELIGGKQKFSAQARGKIQSALLTDLNSQNVAYDVVLFSDDPSATTFSENNALDIADADLPKVFGVISFATSDRVAFASSSVSFKQGLAIPMKGQGDFYAAIVSRGAPTYASTSDVTLSFGIEDPK